MAYPNTFAETALLWSGGKDLVENWLPVLGFEPVAKVNGACSTALPSFIHASKNKGGAVSGQDTLGIRHLSAFDLLDMIGEDVGTALFYIWVGCPDHLHLDRRAIRFELEFILSAVSISGTARDAGHLLCREISNLLARTSRRLDGGYRKSIDLGPVLGF
jgi:hypothetical protein